MNAKRTCLVFACLSLLAASPVRAGFVEYVQVAFSNPGNSKVPLSTGWNFTKTSRLWVDFALTSTADAMKQYRIVQSSDGYAIAYVSRLRTRRFYVGDQRYQYTVANAAATAVPISENPTLLLLR